MKRTVLPVILSLFLLLSLVPSVSAATPESRNLINPMTQSTSVDGSAYASGNNGDSAAWLAFDGVPHYHVGNVQRAWGNTSSTGWVRFDFKSQKVVNKYVLYLGSANGSDTPGWDLKSNLPSSWTIEGSNDGSTWHVLDQQTDFVNWVKGGNNFTFTNTTPYSNFRINVTKNMGSTNNYVNLTIHEMEFWGYDASEIPTDPTDPIDPTDPQPIGDRAILTVTLTTGLEKEFDLPMSEVEAFINWYDAKENGTGPAKYGINKYNNNKGPFSKRTDYVIFKNILSFEVSEYSISE